jgi:hypothetical protein
MAPNIKTKRFNTPVTALSFRMFMNRLLYLAITIVVHVLLPPAYAKPAVHHNLLVNLDPSTDTIAVQDTITLSQGGLGAVDEFSFTLNGVFEPHIDGQDVKIVPTNESVGDPIIRQFRVRLAPEQHRFTLSYHGPLSALHQGQLQTPAQTGGVNLDATNSWYPYAKDQLVSFSLQANLPEGWTALSQGERTRMEKHSNKVIVQWVESHPQDDIHLIAGPYHEYQDNSPFAQIMVLLRNEDQNLASRYIDATKHYLKLYHHLLGPYPYAKFAMVENTLETGYGMPSFTLLGPRVIRLPFILHSSYPHEILHNWWGNSVYVDYSQGNWSEGLTAYLADHLIQEQQGKGSQYRREALQKYVNYVTEQSDFPLNEFHARHGEASQAIGYNKALMFFHMLRLRLGDDTFIEGLRLFYRENRFKHAGYAELRNSFEIVSHSHLGPMFSQWIERRGLPTLSLQQVSVEPIQNGYMLEATLEQMQNEPAYVLDVPLAIKLQGHEEVLEVSVNLKEKHSRVKLQLPARPVSIQLDPRFDLLRRLDPAELPASLGQVFGAVKKTIILPSTAATELKQAYSRLARHWAATDPGIEILEDGDLKELPSDRSIWLLGWENHFLDRVVMSLQKQDVKRQGGQIIIHGRNFNRIEHSVVLTARHSTDQQQAIAWIGTDHPQALRGLERKLPHYSKYSYLVFKGLEPSIVLKEKWAVQDSPLRFDLENQGNTQSPLRLAPNPPLARFAAADSGKSQ